MLLSQRPGQFHRLLEVPRLGMELGKLPAQRVGQRFVTVLQEADRFRIAAGQSGDLYGAGCVAGNQPLSDDLCGLELLAFGQFRGH
ncbi:MAG: hypothetical protein P8179_23275, partial [Candidatus Thiodiazotropha sp.]